jgi:hypothetical protein
MKKNIIIMTENQLHTVIRNALFGMYDTASSGDTENEVTSPSDTDSDKIEKSSTNVNSSSVAEPTIKSKSKMFITLNLNTPKGFKAYSEICNRYINTRKSNLLKISGDMMANAAKNTFNKTGTYVPPEIALAQLAIEGGFVNNPNARPIKTKNPFNVGNVDTGANKYLNDVTSGIQLYYDKMASLYLANNKTPESLLTNFVNKSGRRYASAPNYESSIRTIVNQVKRISDPIYNEIKQNKLL